MSNELICACGRKLRLSEHHLGRRVQCPGCGKSLVVPATGGSAGGAGSGPGHTSPRPSWLPTLILLALLIPGLVGAAITAWWYLRKDKPPTLGEDISELKLIPYNAQGFLRFRVADMWNTPQVKAAVQKARQEDPGSGDPTALLERNTSFRPEQIANLCFVMTGSGATPTGWAIVKTVEPYDPKKVIERISERGKAREQQHAGRSYYNGTDLEGTPISVCFIGPTLLVAGGENEVKACLSWLAQPPLPTPKTILGPLLGRYHDPDHVFGAFDPRQVHEQADVNPMLAPLKEVTLVQLTGQVDQETVVKMQATTDSPEQAKKVLEAINGQKTALGVYLFTLRLKGGQEAKMAGQLSKLLNQFTATQNESEVTGTLKTDLESLLSSFTALAGLFGR